MKIEFFHCKDCSRLQEKNKCEQCGQEALRMIQLYEKGDRVLDDNQRELIITSGNKKYAESASPYDLMVNIHYVRAKREGYVPDTPQLFPQEDDGDFIWYESRILHKLKQKEHHGARA